MGNLCKWYSGDWYAAEQPCVLTSLIKMELQIAEGTARKLIAKFDVKKRSYFGNTSMEAEMSLLMANQAMVRLKTKYIWTLANMQLPLL